MKITIDNLCKSYGEKIVLDHFSAEILPGQTTVLMGASGCGKTTLFRIIMGLERADSGIVHFNEKSETPRLAAVFQENRLCEQISAYKNLRAVSSKHVSDKTIKDILSSMELTPADCAKKTADLSGGMARRVALARAMIAEDAAFTLMDEPFSGLDDGTKSRVLPVVREFYKEKTLLIITHDLGEAQSLADNSNIIHMS